MRARPPASAGAVWIERYDNPLIRMGITFMEILPVGLLVSLVSALVLRRSEAFPAQAPGSVPAAP